MAITMKRILLIINCIILAIGTSGYPLITRLYFIHGGNHIWLSSLLQTVGFPIILLPLFIFYIRHRHTTTAIANKKPKMVTIEPPVFVAAAIIGVLTGLACYLYSYGAARLPVSTYSLIYSTQLAFCAGFAFFLVRQKFTAYSVNSVVLLIIAAGILALHGSGDRPAGESTKQYAMGFVAMSISTALNGSLLPLTELVYKKTKHAITYSLVLEIQLVAGFFASLFSMTGMIINKDFQAIPIEARQFELGVTNYYVVLVGSAIISEVFTLGAVGVIFSASSLLSGIMISMMLPVTEVLAVIFYKESFQAEKGVSLVLSLWGFASYFYGEFKKAKEMRKVLIPETELPQHHSINPNP